MIETVSESDSTGLPNDTLGLQNYLVNAVVALGGGVALGVSAAASSVG